MSTRWHLSRNIPCQKDPSIEAQSDTLVQWVGAPTKNMVRGPHIEDNVLSKV
ncbi:hypothetical protein J1N35_015257 [Gossypium stocksii]|uniref:Uncharacterized protein n=1 Tax=Gossypium stocksii TaxID=47602 RepID=A0A9D3VXJ9_9ROSI|nr:hypothetical protein J1N35_015257 [Gossypium stocksii]